MHPVKIQISLYIFTKHILDSQGCKVSSCGQQRLIRLCRSADWSVSSLGACQKAGFLMLWLLLYHEWCQGIYHNYPQYWERHVWANSVDPELSVSTLPFIQQFLHISIDSKMDLYCKEVRCLNTYDKYGTFQLTIIIDFCFISSSETLSFHGCITHFKFLYYCVIELKPFPLVVIV